MSCVSLEQNPPQLHLDTSIIHLTDLTYIPLRWKIPHVLLAKPDVYCVWVDCSPLGLSNITDWMQWSGLNLKA